MHFRLFQQLHVRCHGCCDRCVASRASRYEYDSSMNPLHCGSSRLSSAAWCPVSLLQRLQTFQWSAVAALYFRQCNALTATSALMKLCELAAVLSSLKHRRC